jgi:hypothetical protein
LLLLPFSLKIKIINQIYKNHTLLKKSVLSIARFFFSQELKISSLIFLDRLSGTSIKKLSYF